NPFALILPVVVARGVRGFLVRFHRLRSGWAFHFQSPPPRPDGIWVQTLAPQVAREGFSESGTAPRQPPLHLVQHREEVAPPRLFRCAVSANLIVMTADVGNLGRNQLIQTIIVKRGSRSYVDV